MTLSPGDAVVFKSDRGVRDAGYILEVDNAEDPPAYSIITCSNGRERRAKRAQLTLAKLDKHLDPDSLESFLDSLGLAKFRENIVAELSTDLLELCEALVDNYDLLEEDMAAVGIAEASHRADILYGLQLIMAQEYRLTQGNRFDDMAAETITRFIRYASAVKSGRVPRGSSMILMHVLSLTNKNKRHRRHHAALMVTRFIRYAGAVQAGKSALVARTFTMHSEGDGKRKRGQGKRSRKSKGRRGSVMKQVYKQRATRKSVYDGEVIVEGYMMKMSSGLLKKWTKRYFSIRGSYLKYFPTKDKEVVRGACDLREVVTCELQNIIGPPAKGGEKESKRHLILLQSEVDGKKVPPLTLEVSEEKEAHKWIKAIEQVTHIVHEVTTIDNRTKQ